MLIGGFQPFTLSDFPGKSAAIVFTQGCNFKCPFCHNRPLWPMATAGPPAHTPERVLSFMEDRKGLLSGLVITGGEPTLQTGLPVFLEKVKAMGFAAKLDTNGSRPEVVSDLLAGGLVDYVAMDVKAPVDKYHLLCGVTVDTDAILRSIDLLTKSQVPHHFRTTYFKPLLSQEDMADLKRLVPPGARHVVQACKEVPH